MKRIALAAFSLLFFCSNVNASSGLGGMGDLDGMSAGVGTAISGIYSFDSKHDQHSFGADINFHLFIINAGANYRRWETKINMDQDEYTGYLGIGFLHLIQAQYGYSSAAGSLLRIRSDIYLFGEKPPYISLDEPFKGIRKASPPIIFYAEKPLDSSDRGWTFGIGLGVAF